METVSNTAECLKDLTGKRSKRTVTGVQHEIKKEGNLVERKGTRHRGKSTRGGSNRDKAVKGRLYLRQENRETDLKGGYTYLCRFKGEKEFMPFGFFLCD